MRLDRHRPQLDGVAVAHGADQRHRRHVRQPAAELRIALVRLARFQHRLRGRAGDHRGAAQALQFGDAARMVEVFVRGQDEADVFDLEAELADVGGDLRGRLRGGAVDQDMPGG
jgi:hypothetical protein